MHPDAPDPLGVRQTQVSPGPAAVGGPVDPVAQRHAVAWIALAGADPDNVRTRLVDRDRADRGHRLVVEDRPKRQSTAGRLPQPAAGGADVDDLRVALHRVDRHDAAAHAGRADRPGLDSREQRRVDVAGVLSSELPGERVEEGGHENDGAERAVHDSMGQGAGRGPRNYGSGGWCAH